MSLHLYFETESFYNTTEPSSLNDRVSELQTIFDKAQEMGDQIKKNDSIYESEFYNAKKLYEWLYVDDDRSSSIEKIMLARLLDRSESVDDNEYANVKMQLETMKLYDDIGFICYSPTGYTELHINNESDLVKLHRYYLRNYTDISLFIEEAGICFPHLYFHEGIKQSVNTLSSPFNEYINEVIRHLSALNDDFVNLFSENKNNLRKALTLFESKSNLECTLEGDRESARSRFSFQFQNINGITVDVVCEPHTKLEGTGNKGDSKYRFDRIYFHQGNSTIEDGKVLIAHIGGHL
ncbi:hypothetical protein AU385_13900 [Bacillus halotolerans]|uniref:hypothetical protein n=1 Tax=Bacillus halotolerans TaxID=260554 RepID=UPI00075016E9|nr:hypothetical protein [Bacillus halotolerans]KUP31873.1 hypothetical protein AU385_13900 [Bacillus halotolerans]